MDLETVSITEFLAVPLADLQQMEGVRFKRASHDMLLFELASPLAILKFGYYVGMVTSELSKFVGFDPLVVSLSDDAKHAYIRLRRQKTD